MSSQVAYHRSPCPGRIFEDLGVGFSIGCVGGSLFYFFKGTINSILITMVRSMERTKKIKNHWRFNPCKE
jgi:hypothetical protein